MSSILTCQDVSINFGGVKAVQNVSLDIRKGSVTSIIGPNGAGKTTFFNIISGVYKPTSGKVLLDGEDITSLPQHEVSKKGMARTFQNIRLFSQLDNVRNVQSALDARANYTMVEAILGLPRKRSEDKKNYDIAMECLELVGLKDFAHDRPGNLPYGMQRKVELARALASNPKLLLLDEPAAGLNPVEVEDFIELLKKIREIRDLTILLIEHRLKVVNTLSDEVFVLNFGELLTHGTPEEVQNHPKVIEAYMGEEEE
ncbi:MAG: ABC transporter ATP-binding protein [Clostridiales bacterium]|nr:ABC transporter ATP-binding protein [Clostridiales bacterium]